MEKLNRRQFAKSAAAAGVFAIGNKLTGTAASGSLAVPGQGRLKISLNAYSFDKPLRAGEITIDELLAFCAQVGLEGVDLTGYYFPGYPEVPTDEYIYHVKQTAFRLGIDLGCTGVKNDFTWADADRRKEEKQLVKNWITVAQKLGAPGLRIFAGTLSKENYTWEARAAWIAEDIRECAEWGRQHGVMLALQNHNDFIKTSEDVTKMLGLVNHPWVGLMLDIGSYHTNDPYRDIEKTAGYAITWQMKEKVFINENQVDTDYNKIVSIVRKCGYRGYLPLETLGEGDPYKKVEALVNKVRAALSE